MFERYTEKARRVIFFARYEASQFGSPYIETEHLLLGILREDKALTNRFLRSHVSVESIRKQIERVTVVHEKTSTSLDLPLSNESKRVLVYAAEEVERLGHKHIGTEHLFLGLLREENSFAANILQERGITVAAAREDFANQDREKAQQTSSATPSPTGLLRDLTQAASEGALDPIIGRDLEVDAILEILCCSRIRNPILLGTRGVGKTAIVQALAQRIADSNVPSGLADKRIVEVEPELLAIWITDRRRFDEFINLHSAISNPDLAILFIDCFHKLSAQPGWYDFSGFLRWLLVQSGIQCIAIADEQEFPQATRTRPWLLDHFAEIHVRPLDPDAALTVLRTRKTALEKFHDVTFSDATLEAAVQSPAADPSRASLPRAALDLLDAAAAMVNLRRDNVPPDIAEVQKRIARIVDRVDKAIQNHEFEKARFYSDEEKKERENLRQLQERQGVDSPSAVEVTPDDIKAVISRWSEYPYTP